MHESACYVGSDHCRGIWKHLLNSSVQWRRWTILSHAAVVLTVFFFTLWTAQRLLVPRKILKSAPIGLTQLDTVFTYETAGFMLCCTHSVGRLLFLMQKLDFFGG